MSEKKPIRVMIVDDHETIRRGLIIFLEVFEDLVLVGEAGDGHEAVRLYQEIAPDVILMDLVMPGMDGVEATRMIRQANPEIPVIALSSFGDQDMIERALQAGASAYLSKDTGIDNLADAIRRVIKS